VVVAGSGGGIGAAAPEEDGEDGEDYQRAHDGGQDPAGVVHLRRADLPLQTLDLAFVPQQTNLVGLSRRNRIGDGTTTRTPRLIQSSDGRSRLE
jgi:hypothetical protein